MPMPPPKATTESPRDRQVEMGQVVRALEQRGPQRWEDLAVLVGADYWEAGRFNRAMAFAAADGLVVEGPGRPLAGRLTWDDDARGETPPPLGVCPATAAGW
jgi:hypothetical protein